MAFTKEMTMINNYDTKTQEHWIPSVKSHLKICEHQMNEQYVYVHPLCVWNVKFNRRFLVFCTLLPGFKLESGDLMFIFYTVCTAMQYQSNTSFILILYLVIVYMFVAAIISLNYLQLVFHLYHLLTSLNCLSSFCSHFYGDKHVPWRTY